MRAAGERRAALARWWYRAALVPLTVVLGAELVAPAALETAEGFSFDLRARWASAAPRGAPAVGLVLRDETSDAELRVLHWPRSLYARALENLRAAGVGVVGVDLLFDAPAGSQPADREADERLAAAVAAGPTVLASRLRTDETLGLAYSRAIPSLSRQALGDGLLNLVPDAAGIVRTMPLYRPHPGRGWAQPLPSFALAVYLGAEIDAAYARLPAAAGEWLDGLAGRWTALLREVRVQVGNREVADLFGVAPPERLAAFAALRAGFDARPPWMAPPGACPFEDPVVERLFEEASVRRLLREQARRLRFPVRWPGDRGLGPEAFQQSEALVSALRACLGAWLPAAPAARAVQGPDLLIDPAGLAALPRWPVARAADEVALHAQYLSAALEAAELSGRSLEVTLQAPGPAELRGRVEGVDGRPAAGARVLYAAAGAPFAEASAGEDGRFRLSGLVAGPGVLRIEAPSARGRTVLVATVTTPSAAGRPLLVVSPVGRGVVRGFGLPPGAGVRLEARRLFPTWAVGAGDRFRVPLLGPRARLVVRSDEDLATRSELVAAWPPEAGAEDGGGRIRLAALAQDEASGELTGLARLAEPAADGRFFVSVDAEALEAAALATATVDAAGAFEATDLAPGDWEVSVAGRGATFASVEDGRPATVEASQLFAGPPAGPPPAFALAGRVAPRGAGARVRWVALADGRAVEALADGEGSFRLPRVPAGRGVLLADGPDGARAALGPASLGVVPQVFLIGTSLEADQDFYQAPAGLGRVPGVELHAASLMTLQRGTWWRRPDRVVRAGLTLALFAAVTLAFTFLSLERALVAWALLTAGWVVGTFAAAASWRLWLPLVSPLVLLVACPGAFLGLRAMEARREATRRRAVFAKFVNPTLVDRLLGQDEVVLQGERRELTVLFCDIRGFTTMSEEMDPQEVSGALAEHFNRLTPVLLRHEGTLDKYIGDALMAFFGAPVHQADHARRAVAAALEMAAESRRLAEERASRQDRTWPPFRVGFGLASGPCHVGLVGSDEVFNYSVLGDTVNLAARLEGLTKDLGCEVLLSEETWTLVQDAFDGRFVGEVEVKGKRRKVRVFTVTGPRPMVS